MALLKAVLVLTLPVVWSQTLPFIVTTWAFTHNATDQAWNMLHNQQLDVVDSIVGGCSVCEVDKLCGANVGPGDKPSESGEVTQDAMIMDGRTMDVGSVGGLRRIKNAIGVAHAVLKHTKHTLLVGELATDFAKQMGFPEEDLSSNRSHEVWQNWQNNNCQPNFWENVTPDPTTSCGPYSPNAASRSSGDSISEDPLKHLQGEEPDHDTIGMVAVDASGNVASGTSTNGLTYKLAGRVGDSPIPGAGSYAENGVGAAAGTGNGDVMMRFLPSYHAVQLMREGLSPLEAAKAAVLRFGSHYPESDGAVIAVNTAGEHGAACFGYTTFEYHYIGATTGGRVDDIVDCEIL